MKRLFFFTFSFCILATVQSHAVISLTFLADPDFGSTQVTLSGGGNIADGSVLDIGSQIGRAHV